ncbi:MAG TPA: glycosyltransferase [Methanotrichaceae archaeon]|nr:glycosyltransferase [Methanotrichaceae archaeon]
MDEVDYIIPTWNSASTLQITLQSIKKFGNPDRILVIDRSSTDSTHEIAESMGCDVIEFQGPLGAARRLGARQAGTDLVAFIDSDVEVTKGWRKALEAASRGTYQDAGAIGGYYKGTIPAGSSFPIRLIGGNGAFGCTITYRDLVMECDRLDLYSSAEDKVYAEFLGEKGLCWYILPVELVHHQGVMSIPYYHRWRWLGAGLRTMEGFRLSNVKRIMGGAVLGIRMNGMDIGYWENFQIRYNYFIGYLRHRKYYEIDRNISV